jgi:hypothetical protein
LDTAKDEDPIAEVTRLGAKNFLSGIFALVLSTVDTTHCATKSFNQKVQLVILDLNDRAHRGVWASVKF